MDGAARRTSKNRICAAATLCSFPASFALSPTLDHYPTPFPDANGPHRRRRDRRGAPERRGRSWCLIFDPRRHKIAPRALGSVAKGRETAEIECIQGTALLGIGGFVGGLDGVDADSGWVPGEYTLFPDKRVA